MADNTQPRRRGRKTIDPSGAKSANVGLRLTAGDFDRVYALTKTRGESVQEFFRRVIRRELERQPRQS